MKRDQYKKSWGSIDEYWREHRPSIPGENNHCYGVEYFERTLRTFWPHFHDKTRTLFLFGIPQTLVRYFVLRLFLKSKSFKININT